MKYPYLRRLPGFEYLAPETIDEALSLLSSHNGKAKVIAGGTDLLHKMKRREEIPQYLIGLKNIPGLNHIDYDEAQGLRFGPLVTIHAVEISPLVRERFPILSQAASTMASAQVRNLGTIVGNLCTALPSADMAPGLIVLGANLKLANSKGERTIAVEDFFTGPSESVLAHNELVVEVQVPNPLPHSGMVYIKHTVRAAMELAIVGVATIVTLQDGACSDAKIALGAVAPTPMRATKAESLLRGKPFSAGLVRKAAAAASEEARPISDIRGSTEYRKEMVRTLTARALNKAKEEID
ncbi:MAG TPA: xanthine dehydrogenase family protein subunit M [Desulfatiglandales bacterium]|nr:xanthine dehydrogenase family protein subunit M [Desulfatiglandales bacterium]